jgi:hypothetical protein
VRRRFGRASARRLSAQQIGPVQSALPPKLFDSLRGIVSFTCVAAAKHPEHGRQPQPINRGYRHGLPSPATVKGCM